MRQVWLHTLTAAAAGLFLISLTSQGFCQFGIESYALSHPFGLSTATTCRQFGMGGPVSCVWDHGSGNPAFAATQTEETAGVRWSHTGFDGGMSLDSYHLYEIHPLRANETGLQFSFFSLRSRTGRLGPATLDVSEDDFSIHYGRRIAKKWTAGIGLAPWYKISVKATLPNGITALDLDAKPSIGARAGLTYEPEPGDYWGIVYDYMLEDVTGTGVALPGGHQEQVFHTDLLALGASRHITPELLVAVEWQDARTQAGDLKRGIHGWHLGAEYRWPRGCALRAGLNDGQMTLGAGYQSGRWEAEYAFMNNWNNEAVAAAFGASDTHQLQAVFHW
jgi:hypothetical protein